MPTSIIDEIKKNPQDAEMLHKLGSYDQAPDRKFNLSDIGNAQRLVSLYGEYFKYIPLWGKFIIFNGVVWVIDSTGQVERMAKETIMMIYKEASKVFDDDARTALVKHAHKSESYQRLRAMLELAKSEPGVSISPDELDKNIWLISFMNKTLNLQTGKSKPHDKYDLITKMIPLEYKPQAEFIHWAKFLKRIFNNNDSLIDYIQRVVGYCLTGSMKEQILIILFGNGANGKSTFLEILRLILNDYAKQAPIETFLAKSNDSLSNDIARLKGARLVTASEIGEGRRLNESLVKQITGGDMLTARFLHQEFFEFAPQFKLWIATNHKPVIRGTDNGIWRRIRLIPFEVTIPPEEQDKDLLEKLKTELPGILNWAAMGCFEWQKRGLEAPAAVVNATSGYRNEMDILASFIDDCTVSGPCLCARLNEMYTAYVKWCSVNGEKELSQIKFGTRLSERGFDKKRGSGGTWFWQGIGLKTDDDKDNPF